MDFLQSAGPIPTTLIIGLAVLGIYYVADQIGRIASPRIRHRQSYDGSRTTAADSAEQLRWVMAASFAAKRVMNLSEYKVFKEVEAELRTVGGGYRVFSQTALGEVLRSEDKRAHSAINAKRVDVLVVAPNGLPVLAVEYQGPGHYQGDAAARDAVKREALRKAGVAYVEAFETDEPQEIRRKVREVLASVAAA
ncbi:MAG: DUF2726 domain-containing protein [Devosia sp.]